MTKESSWYLKDGNHRDQRLKRWNGAEQSCRRILPMKYGRSFQYSCGPKTVMEHLLLCPTRPWKSVSTLSCMRNNLVVVVATALSVRTALKALYRLRAIQFPMQSMTGRAGAVVIFLTRADTNVDIRQNSQDTVFEPINVCS